MSFVFHSAEEVRPFAMALKWVLCNTSNNVSRNDFLPDDVWFNEIIDRFKTFSMYRMHLVFGETHMFNIVLVCSKHGDSFHFKVEHQLRHVC